MEDGEWRVRSVEEERIIKCVEKGGWRMLVNVFRSDGRS
jgi:hypothetical protein